MSKMGATAAALLALASFAGSASAQAAGDCAPQLGPESRCHGPKDDEKKVCCPGLVCMQKDEWYGQCKPEGEAAPDGWDGTIVDYSGEAGAGGGDAETPTDDAADGEDESGDDVEVPAELPPAAPLGDAKYMAVIAKDYIPNVANMVMLEDIKPVELAGNVVTSQQECENLCTGTEGCNAASYYLDASVFDTQERNCWLKIIADSCELPSDALDDANAVMLLKIDETCGDLALGPMGAFAEGPDGAMGPESMGPGAEGPIGMMDDVTDRDGDLDGGLDEPSTDTPLPPSASPVAGVTGAIGGSPPATVDAGSPSSAPAGLSGVMMALAATVAAIAAF